MITIHSTIKKLGCLLVFTVGHLSAYAAVDISSDPLNTYSAASSTDVKPNLMFILDNSGSMDFSYMPDDARDFSGGYGFMSNHCNGVYYNPNTNYTPPIKADGVTSYPNASFTAALRNGYDTNSGTVNLSTAFVAISGPKYDNGYNNYSGFSAQAAFYYKYTGNETAESAKNYSDTGSTFYLECDASSNGPFTKVIVGNNTSPQGGDERENFANWYSYYRTRLLMMKTASGIAFKDINDRFRVGFMTINNVTGTKDFVNIKDFDADNKTTWYDSLYINETSGSTPLRGALADAGRMYGGKLTSRNGVTVTDPVQYSCQQNYTILSTDGFWNGGDPYKLDGTTALGNQDGALPRPFRDGASVLVQQRTKALQSQTISAQTQTQTSSLQKRTTSNVSAPSIQTRTSANSGSTWTGWTNVASCTADTTTASRRDCRFPISTSSDRGDTWTAWAYASSCTAKTSGTNRTQCSGSVPITTGWSNVASCTIASGTECQYTAWTAATPTASCTALARDTSSPYTVGTATQCSTTNTLGPWVDAASCTVSGTLNCQYAGWTGYSTVSACTEVAGSSGSPYTVQTVVGCNTVTDVGSSDTLADVAAYYYNTDLRDADATGVDDTGTCAGPMVDAQGVPNDLCANNVPKNGRDVAVTQHMTTFSVGLGVRGRMAYSPTYLTDTSGDFFAVSRGLTAGSGVCSWQNSGACNWPTPASDALENVDDLWHAAVNGHGTYFSATDPDTLAKGLKDALATIINTPRPGTAAAAASSNPNVSATDNYVFSSSYKSVEWYGELVRQRIGTDGVLSAQNWSAMRLLDCATTSWKASHAYLPGDVFRQGDFCYVVRATYTSEATFGGEDAANTVVVNVDETATPLVPAAVQTSRTIYTPSESGGDLINFQWLRDAPQAGAGLSPAQQNYFKAAAITYVSKTVGLTQFCPEGGPLADDELACLSAADQTAAAGEPIVNFLRGDRTYEGAYFRSRVHVLGDIVSSEARYVQGSLFDYSDTNYSAFKTLRSSRAGRVYVGSNDGMLHAFDSASGQEAWAYIPSKVLPNLYKLADRNYQKKHQYFVDNSPETGDICPKAPSAICSKEEWKTILVGGLNLGGKGYYALDITDPDVPPKLLWEFTNTDLGYSYGNPRITKLEDGTWVVLLSTGYNNTDGESRMFVLNANTGVLIRTISTGVKSGFARMSAHVLLPAVNNTAIAAYGGDTEGNLWRFDINGDIGATGYDAHLLVKFTDSADKAQPITVKPLQATINGNPVVFVGTGRFLGESDIKDKSTQSFYAVKDKLDDTTYGDPRLAGTNFVKQTLTKGECPKDAKETICLPKQEVILNSNNAVDWTTKNGWYMDFVTGGERSSTDPSLGLGTLLFTTITPQASTAAACGVSNDSAASFLYALDYLTGGAINGTEGVVGFSLGSSLVTRPVMIKQADGTVRALIRTSSGSSGGTDLGETIVIAPPINPPSPGGVRRVSWRLLNAR